MGESEEHVHRSELAESVASSAGTRGRDVPMPEPRRYRHTVRVRYGEVDRQGVVFNAHYLAYMDDALENWIATLGDLRRPHGWDMMLKKATLEWQGSVGSGDRLDIDLAIVRWGRTSWTVGYLGTCRGQPVFTGEVVYVSVRLGANEAIETPGAIRAALGDAVDLFGAGTERAGHAATDAG